MVVPVDSLSLVPPKVTTKIFDNLNPSDWSSMITCARYLFERVLGHANSAESIRAKEFNQFIKCNLRVSVKSEMLDFNHSSLLQLRNGIASIKCLILRNLIERPQAQISVLKQKFYKEDCSRGYEDIFDVCESMKELLKIQLNHSGIPNMLQECMKLIVNLQDKEGQIGCYRFLNYLRANEKVYHLYVCSFAWLLCRQDKIEQMESLLLTYSKPFDKFNDTYNNLYSAVIAKYIKTEHFEKANLLIKKLEKRLGFEDIIYKACKKLVDSDLVHSALGLVERNQRKIEEKYYSFCPKSLELLLESILLKNDLESAFKLIELVNRKLWSDSLRFRLAKNLVERREFKSAYNLLMTLEFSYCYEKDELLEIIATSEVTLSNYDCQLNIAKAIKRDECRNKALLFFLQFFQSNHMWVEVENLLSEELIWCHPDPISTYFDVLIKKKIEERAYPFIANTNPSKQDKFYSLFAIALWKNKQEQTAYNVLDQIQSPKTRAETLSKIGVWECRNKNLKGAICILDQVEQGVDREQLIQYLIEQFVMMRKVDQIISFIIQEPAQQQERFLGIAFNLFLQNDEVECGVKIANTMPINSRIGHLINPFERLFDGKESSKLLDMIEGRNGNG